MKRKAILLCFGGLLAVVLIVFVAYGLFSGRHYPQAKACENELLVLRRQLELYKRERGDYPSSDDGLAALTQSTSQPNFHQFLTEIPVDPWNRAYRYIKPGRRNPESFDLYSFGADGKESGDDIYAPNEE